MEDDDIQKKRIYLQKKGWVLRLESVRYHDTMLSKISVRFRRAPQDARGMKEKEKRKSRTSCWWKWPCNGAARSTAYWHGLQQCASKIMLGEYSHFISLDGIAL